MVAIVRSIWVVLDRPIFGTQHRSQWVYVEGRLTRIQIAAVLGLGGGLVLLLGKLVLPTFGKYLGKFLEENVCTVGWFGWSLSGEVSFVLLIGLSASVTIGAAIFLFHSGLRIYKNRRSLPIGYKPLFRTRVFEGKHAIFLGVCQISAGVVFMMLLVFLSINAYYPLSIQFLKSPNSFKQCTQR